MLSLPDSASANPVLDETGPATPTTRNPWKRDTERARQLIDRFGLNSISVKAV